MLEFPSWELAKPWSYISGYAFVDGLRQLGHEVELAVLLYEADEAALARVLYVYQKRGDYFDCAFFWMPHLNYGEAFWRTAERIAKRRIGVLVESMMYTHEEIRYLPHLAKRRTLVLGHLRHCTHAVTLDYHDFLDLEKSGHRVFWMPGIIPRVPDVSFVRFEEKSERILTAGTVYAGKRRALHEYLSSRGVIDGGERLEHCPPLIAEFENAISVVAKRLSEGSTVADGQAAERVRLVRMALWHEYLQYLSRFSGVVSLPAYFKGFPGRVFEGMLAGCAVFMFEASDLDRQKKVFAPSEHIHYLPADITDEAVAKIVEVARDSEGRRRLTLAARDRAFATCEASFITGQIMKWVEEDARRMPPLLGRTLRYVFSAGQLNHRVCNEPSYEAS